MVRPLARGGAYGAITVGENQFGPGERRFNRGRAIAVYPSYLHRGNMS